MRNKLQSIKLTKRATTQSRPAFTAASLLFLITMLGFIITPNINNAQVMQSESFDVVGGTPAGWTQIGYNSAYLYTVSSGTNPTQMPYAGAGELLWNTWYAPIDCTQTLVSPPIDWSMKGANTPTMSFWFHRDLSYNTIGYDAEGVNVYVNTSQTLAGATYLGFVPRRAGFGASGPYLVSGPPTVTTMGWYNYGFNIPPTFGGSTNYILFKFVAKYGTNTFMDELQWTAYPNIDFSLIPNSTCTYMNVVATNMTTTTNANTYSWNWGDGNTDTQVNTTTISHQYAYPGTYTVNLNLYTSYGAYLGSKSKVVNIQQGTNGTFYMSKDSVCPGENVTFDPWPNQGFVKWNMSDGYTSTNYYISRTINTVGTYTVSAIFNTPCGPDTIQRVLKVVNSIYPNANFSLYPSPSVCPNKNVQFNPLEYPGTHSWSFGDATTSTLQSPYHPYSAQGIYSITHTLTNTCGNTSVQTNTVSVDLTTYPNNANFSYNPNTTVCPGVQITFNSNAYDGTSSWNFGDGGTATGTGPKHTYTTAGTYTVTHTVTNECGNSVSQTSVVTISNTLAPDGTFNFYPYTACPNDLISFNPNEPYGLSYSWNFGDGATSSLKNPSHKFTTAGTYTITLSVTNYCNLTTTTTQTITINGNLPMNYSGMVNAWPQPACFNQPINIDAGAWGYPTYIFNYGDGSSDTLGTPYTTHSYSAAGTYTTSVTIINNCGQDTVVSKVVTVSNSIPFPNYSLNAYPETVCPGENVGVNAAWGYPDYLWTMGDGSPAFNSSNNYVTYSYSTLGPKIITVKLTDFCGNDSTYSDTVLVQNSTAFCNGCSMYAGANSPSCPNEAVGFSGSSGYAWYKWEFGDGDTLVTSSYQATHTYSVTGTYNYTLTITNFCGVDTVLYSSVVIDNTQQVPNWLSVNAYPDVVCPGQAVNFQTQSGYQTYQWNFGDGFTAYGTSNVAHTYSVAGTYNASVTITNACGNSTTISTSVLVSPTASFPSWMNLWYNPDPACPGGPVTLETTAGYLSYVWDFGDGQTITTSTEKVTHVYGTAGNYSASVVVTNGCGASVTLYKTVTISSNVNINWLDIYLPSNPACAGDVVMLNINTSYPAGMTFSWDYGDGSPLDTTIGIGSSHTYASAGVYNVVVTATNACGNSKTASKLVTINSNATPQLNPWSFGILSDNTNGGSNSVCPGDVVVFYFEGINPNNLWNFGDGSSGVATDLFVRADGVTVTTIKHAYTTAGTYNFSLTLTNSCGNSTTLTKTINVTTGMLISGGFMIQPPSSTLGYTTCGPISFVAFGGNNFSWDFGDGSTLSTISPSMNHAYVNSGNYTVKVTITNGCGDSATYTKTLIVNGVGGTVVNSQLVAPPSCSGSANGSATVNVSGGQAPYTYAWTNSLAQTVSTGVSATNLPAGTYTVTVTDNAGCAGVTSITLTDPTSATMTVSTTPSACGGATGTATVANITGGTAPFVYSWSNGQTGATASNLALGSYTITVTDANGCTENTIASVSENGATVSVSTTTSVTCNGSSNGAIDINVTGGTAPYTYLWSNGSTSQDLTGLASGTYSVVVTDNSGCNSTISVPVTQPGVLNVNATSVASPTCGNFDGSAIANVTGGTGPYTYLWPAAGNATTQTVSGLPAGTYTVQVTDSKGCTQNGIVTLSNSNAPNVASNVVDVSCNGGSDGSIDMTVTGGTSPYLYNWNIAGQQNNQDVTGLAPGMYIVSIQDAAGCITLRSYTIDEPVALSGTVANTGASCGNNDGIATVTPAGGTAPYTYAWTGGQTTQTAIGLQLGSYTVTVTDDNGCVATATTTIGQTIAAASICMVTVDTASTHNIIYWDKTTVTAVDSFKIYREDVTNVYTHIGTVAYDSLSEYHDWDTSVANPNANTKRYKISSVDTCGNESALSNYHNTIFIVSAGNGQFTWNPLYTIENSANPVNNYVLMRDDTNSGVWAQVAITAGTQNTIADPNYASYPNASYYVETVWGISCDPTRAIINTSRSNIKNMAAPILGVAQLDPTMLTVSPNPFNTEVKVVAKSRIIKVEIYNSLGQIVYAEQVAGGNQVTIGTGHLASGMYHVRVMTEAGRIDRKLIKQ